MKTTPLTLLTLCCLALPGCTRNSASVDRSNGAIPELRAVQVAPGSIKLDGRLDDPGWRAAGCTGPLVHPGTGRPVPSSPVAASACLSWSTKALYCWFDVRDSNPSSPFNNKQVDPHIWSAASGVELMIQPGDHGDNRHYFELQVDVAGAVWDTRFDDYNQPITRDPASGGRRFGHQQWSARVRKGIMVKEGVGYTMELAIPWTALKSARAKTPPRASDSWRVNLYSFRDGQRHALAWSPLLGQGNFHRASRFGRVTFRGPRK